jgi:hypothetical protein
MSHDVANRLGGDCQDSDVLEILEIAKYATKPRVGEHTGRLYTLPDGHWLVLKFSNPGGKPQSYFILSVPSLMLASKSHDQGHAINAEQPETPLI